ncbi:hypothetical protein H4R35_005844, partial [Dimargaris xerosporica]
MGRVTRAAFGAFIVAVAFLAQQIKWSDVFLNFNTPIPDWHTEQCTTIDIPEACEDIVLHAQSQSAFFACGSSAKRTKWFPPMGIYTQFTADQDVIYHYDIKTGETIPLRFANFNKPYCAHGIGIYADPAEPDRVTLMAINHDQADSVIEIFDYRVGSKSLDHVETVAHPLITTPNDVAPLSRRSFYVTNDHYYPRGLPRLYEFLTASPWGSLVLRHWMANGTDHVGLASPLGVPYPNGIDIDPKQRVTVITSITTRQLLYYDIQPDTLQLIPSVAVGPLPFFPDNVHFDPETLEAYAAGLSKPLDYMIPKSGDIYNIGSTVAWESARFSLPAALAHAK